MVWPSASVDTSGGRRAGSGDAGDGHESVVDAAVSRTDPATPAAAAHTRIVRVIRVTLTRRRLPYRRSIWMA